MMKRLAVLTLLASAVFANAGFTITATSGTPFSFQWFEPSWDSGTSAGFGNCAFNPGTGLNVNLDTMYQTGFWYRANRTGVQDMGRELQITRYMNGATPTPDSATIEAYETSPASGLNSGLKFTFTSHIFSVSPTQSYVRVDWTVQNLVTAPGADYEVNLFPYADLQTSPNTASSDMLAWNSATRTFTYTNAASGKPSVTYRAITPGLESYGNGPYLALRGALSNNGITSGLGSGNPNPNVSQDYATAFHYKFTLGPGEVRTGSVGYGHNMVAPDPATISGNISLESLAVSPANRPVSIELRDVSSDALVQKTTATLSSNGDYTFATGVQGSFRAYAKASHWLRKSIGIIQVGSTGATNVNASLVNGDIDGDNVVSVFDYILLSDQFDYDSGNMFFDPERDLDGDGVISVFDYIILSDNFDNQGD